MKPVRRTSWVHLFGAGRAGIPADALEVLGSKGANLAEIAGLGIPVPPGFIITTDVCALYYANGLALPETLRPEIAQALAEVGRVAGCRFGDVDNPLLVSVRSGARVSMPGMMDTILNLGLNDATAEGLAKRSGNARFAYDSYRRFIQMYGSVVMGIDHGVFEDRLDQYKNLHQFTLDTDLGPEDWRAVVAAYKALVLAESGQPFPDDVQTQLWGAIGAVFGSWRNKRAKNYRSLHGISEDWGTAVTVQVMVFGNLGQDSATGVAFTRNPSTGAKEIYGEFLLQAQGEDVVAGLRTPQPLTEAARRDGGSESPSLETLMPTVFEELLHVFRALERYYKDMQDVEFTVENSALWILQTRSGKRSLQAALEIAAALAEERVITREDAVLRIDPGALDQLLHPTIDPASEKRPIARGLPASPGAAVGEIAFTPEDAERARSQGKDVILVRAETSPEDIHGMYAAAGILTARGGMTSHAAVVARGMGRPCVCGAGLLRIDIRARTMSVNGRVFKAGDIITIDGSAGQVFEGRVAMRQPELSGAFATVMGWADAARRLGVRANAETPRDAEQARYFGAEGIGLCRTEHMFFDEARILAMREMICAATEQGRRAALARMLPEQRADFTRLFEIMAGLPVTIRLLDPPLHEFLPSAEREQAAVAAALGLPLEKLVERVAELSEINPMLGMRGSRLAVRFPEIVEMQTRAILEAAAEAAAKTRAPVRPEILIPFAAFEVEFALVAKTIRATAATIARESGVAMAFTIGAMVELPRTALRAGDLVRGELGAEFLSFGTNDLTQTALGLSRDDAAPIIAAYVKAGIFTVDPFVSLEQDGVGELVMMGTTRARAARSDVKIGICGEHGGDPASIAFFHAAGLDYVSCSPYRVPIARLAAAQAAIREKGVGGSRE